MRLRLKTTFEELKEAIGRLSERDQRALVALAAVLGFFILLGLGGWAIAEVGDLNDTSTQSRQALSDLRRFGSRFQTNRLAEKSLRAAISDDPLELNTFVETAASAAGVEIDESVEIGSIVGKRFTRRGLEIKIHKIGLGELTRLLARLTRAPGHVVKVTTLNINTRWGSPDELDVELVVSTYERNRKGKAVSERRSRARR